MAMIMYEICNIIQFQDAFHNEACLVNNWVTNFQPHSIPQIFSNKHILFVANQ